MRVFPQPVGGGLALLALWALTLCISLFFRPLLPVDETRYLSVAWEMWQRSDFLVPWLNGEPYSHKPPLLFWLVHAGWFAFGVNEWWPRLIAPLFSLASLYLARVIAQRLWPSDTRVFLYAPWILFGILPWTLFYTLTQFDMLLVSCVLIGVLGLLRVVGGQSSGWVFFALGIGLGALTKGPVILVHLLPVALFAPLWVSEAPAGGWPRWYAGVFASLVIGVLIALVWAIPAAQSGGEGYAQAIFWAQSAERVINSFAHREPVWWYLAWLPLLVMPWLLWVPVWRGLGDRALWRDRGIRLLLVWVLPVLIILSLVSGKQLKYLMPLVPAFALLIARGLTQKPDTMGRPWPAFTVLLLGGLFLMVVPFLQFPALPYWSDRIAPGWGVLLFGLAVLLMLAGRVSERQGIRRITLGSALLVIVFHLAVVRPAAPAYDVAEVSRRINNFQASGATVAHVGKYHGQFHFLGRLSEPLEALEYSSDRTWAQANPGGYLVFYTRHTRIPVEGSVYDQPWRSQEPGLMIWKSEDFLMLE